MTILVTNDDGVHSSGLMALFKAMKELGEAYVVAPDRERSAAGHSLTLHKPLKVQSLRERVWCINGTPTDCVAIAVEKILPGRPSLIISGINRGENLGDDITYSGTVAAAMEGTILGIPSIAVSLSLDDKHPLHYETAAHFATEAVIHVMENPLPFDTLLNINIPNLPLKDIKGLKFTRQGKRTFTGAIHEYFSPSGEQHFWLGGGQSVSKGGDNTDILAVADGFVSITPLHLDLSNHKAIEIIRDKWKTSPEPGS